MVQATSNLSTEGSAAPWTPWTPWQRGEGSSISYGQRPVQRVLLIAEIANAHQGKPSNAMKLVEAAAEAGCDAVKFQKYYASEMLAPGHGMTETFNRLEWEEAAWHELFAAAKSVNLKVFVDVFGVRAFQSLEQLPPVDGLKLHGADVGNVPLLDLLATTACPILIGTGGCSDLDIHLAASSLGNPERLVLMHGYQGFPCPLEDTALRRIPHLLETFGLAVGLSDHLAADDSFANLGPLLAIPLGVCCIEKHLTLDRSAREIDHESSLNPDEMRQLALWVRQAELAQGGVDLPASASEEGYRRRFKKSLIAIQPIAKGEAITTQRVAFRMVEDPPRYSLRLDEAMGRTAIHEIPDGRLLSADDLDVSAGICIIARLKSKRLPRKALADIQGKPALAHLFERIKTCLDTGPAVLCTSTHPDDAPLIALAREWGIDTYAGSPEQPLERLIACAEMYGWQYVVRLTGDNLFPDPELLSRAVGLAQEQNLDYVSTSLAPVGTHCEVFSTVALRIVQQYADAPYTTEYLTWFVAGNPNFRSMDLPVATELQRNYRLTLDTPEDLGNIRDLVGLLDRLPQPYTLNDVVRAVESDPDLERRCTMVPGNATPPAPVKFKFNVNATSAQNQFGQPGATA